jgi:iron complex outermembrane receptor protein
LFELYSPGALSTQTVSVKGFNAIIPTNLSLGNQNLKPEAADTTTVGAVWQPKWAGNRMSVSLDYFDINIKDAITSLDATSISSLCNAGQAVYCNAFTFNPTTGAPTSLTLGALNAASVEQIGIDMAVSYLGDVSSWFSRGAGDLNTSLDATYVRHVYVNSGAVGAATIDRAGENSQQNLYSMPRLRATMTSTYALGRASGTAQIVFTGPGTIDNTFNTLPSLTINDNHVPGVAYLNLFGAYKVLGDEKFIVSGGITNAFNKAPPPVPNTPLLTATNGAYYDVVGRAFQLGVSMKF